MDIQSQDIANLPPYLLWGPAASLFLVLALIPLMKLMAFKTGYTDQPGGRKKHEDSIPLVGGLAVFPVFIAVSALFIKDWALYAPLFTAIFVLLGVGAWDDRFHVRASLKFFAQIFAAVLVVFWGGAYINGLGNLLGFGGIWLGFLKETFALVAMVLLINSTNLMDGLDGLAGGVGFIVSIFLAVAAFLSGQIVFLGPLLVFITAMLGFLIYNKRHPWRRKASVFMGDAGSLSLGLLLGWFSLQLVKSGNDVIEPISIAWFLALPIADTCAQFARRMAQGRHPFSPDYHHFHHHFMTAGIPHHKTVWIIWGIMVVCGVAGLAGPMLGVPEFVLAYLWIALLLSHMFLSMRPRRYRRIILRLFRIENPEEAKENTAQP